MRDLLHVIAGRKLPAQRRSLLLTQRAGPSFARTQTGKERYERPINANEGAVAVLVHNEMGFSCSTAFSACRFLAATPIFAGSPEQTRADRKISPTTSHGSWGIAAVGSAEIVPNRADLLGPPTRNKGEAGRSPTVRKVHSLGHLGKGLKYCRRRAKWKAAQKLI